MGDIDVRRTPNRREVAQALTSTHSVVPSQNTAAFARAYGGITAFVDHQREP